MDSGWKKYILPLVMSIGGSLIGTAMSIHNDKETQDMVAKAARSATRSEFDRIARQKHGDARHTG